MHKNIYVSIISFFLLIAIISGVMIHGHFKEADEQEELYNNLAQIVEKNETSPETETPMPTTPPEGGELVMLPEYAELYEQNNDLIGWICIEDTKINYPVMQSLDEPNFYLKHGFDKGYCKGNSRSRKSNYSRSQRTCSGDCCRRLGCRCYYHCHLPYRPYSLLGVWYLLLR